MLVTLLFIAYQVHQNNRVLKWQTNMQFAHQMANPFFTSPELVQTMTKIKAVDGSMPAINALINRYSLEPSEAELWFRHLSLMWMQIEADFGYGQNVEDRITLLMQWQDQKLYWAYSKELRNFDDDFMNHVEKIMSKN